MQTYTTTLIKAGHKAPVFMHTTEAMHKAAALAATLERFVALNPKAHASLAVVGLEDTPRHRHASFFKLTRLGAGRIAYQPVAA